MNIIQTIKELSEELYPEILKIRRHLHRFPELSFQEHETANYIVSVLEKVGIPCRKGIAGTGILAEVSGTSDGRIIALRADMDALPVLEENDVEYRSEKEGVMHACGHDVHSSSLIGTAMILIKLQDKFTGKVKLVFQPGEEKAPGGARLMLEEKLFGDEEPELMMAQHVYPSMLSGKTGFREGKYMASCDEIYITVKGKGGHAAMPHMTTDTVLIASHILVALQQIVSRNAKASTPTVLSFGRMIADGAVNVIPSEVRMEGTFRTMDENWRKDAHKSMMKMAQSIAESMGGICDFNVVEGYPALYNDPVITRKTKEFAASYLGMDAVEELDIRMTAEDFSFFAEKYPSVLYRLGVRNHDKNEALELHTPTFNIDEEALKTGMGTMAWLAISHLI
ncbi:M20 family metallopeptidase [Bacteroidota bacterium]